MNGQGNDLDLLLAGARDEIQPSAALMERVLADAAALQPRVMPVRAAPPSRGWLAGLFDVFGGSGAVAGMSAVTAAGLFLGFVQPTSLSSLTEALQGGTEVVENMELLPADGLLWAGE
jgi:hypothetical protein